MSSRDRKRADRRKRKERSSGREPEVAAPSTNGSGGAPANDATPPEATTPEERPETIEDVAAEAERRGIPKSEVRNERAREDLMPLEEGERPLVVTIGAVISTVIAVATVVAYVSGVEVNIVNSTEQERPNPISVFAPAVLFAVMAGGMWQAKYWAVLGFQAIMAIVMVGSVLTLITSTSIFQALSVAAVLIVSAALFWFTVKALARIQMPEKMERPPR